MRYKQRKMQNRYPSPFSYDVRKLKQTTSEIIPEPHYFLRFIHGDVRHRKKSEEI